MTNTLPAAPCKPGAERRPGEAQPGYAATPLAAIAAEAGVAIQTVYKSSAASRRC